MMNGSQSTADLPNWFVKAIECCATLKRCLTCLIELQAVRRKASS